MNARGDLHLYVLISYYIGVDKPLTYNKVLVATFPAITKEVAQVIADDFNNANREPTDMIWNNLERYEWME